MLKIRKLGGVSSEQDDAGKPVTDDTDSTTDASANAGAGSGVADAAAGEQTTANKSEATDGAATEESKSDAVNDTVTEESKADAANGTETEESKSDAADGAVTEESKSDAAHGTGAEESKADAGHGSHAGGSSVVGAGSVGIDESTGAAVEIEETKPEELLEEETKLATESEIPKEEDEKKLEENRKLIYTDIRAGIKVTATLEDADAVPDEARLHVTEIKNDKMYAAYLEAMDEAEPEIKHTKKNTVLRDISFIMKDENGKEIEYEPTEGSVKITIEYLENHLQDWFGVEDAAEVKTYHLPLAEGVKAEGEKTIDVKNVKASDINVQELDSDVKTEKEVEVEVDSFSMFAMARKRVAKAGKTTSTDLSKFLTDITIDGVSKNSDGSYTIKPETDYKFRLHFEEEDKHDGLQFDDNEPLTYTLPSGFETIPTSKQGTCDIELLHEGIQYIIYNNTWNISGSTLTFNWNKLDQNFGKLTSAANTEFYIELSGKAQNGKSELEWSAGTDITVKVDNTSRVNVTKTGSLDLTNKKINYEIKVTSDGHNTIVVVEDEITGTALTYNKDAVLTSNKANPVQTTASSANDRGFSYTIPEMQNGEVVTIKYSASIDKNKIKGNGTVEETNNGVTVKSTEDPDEKKDSKDFHNEINYTPKLDKTSGAQGAVTNGYTIIPYTITYNEDRNVSVAGHKITDTIGDESKARMTYDGPVTIEVYNRSNEKVATRKITPASGNWSYTIPKENIPNEDTENYKYVFTYNAKVDVKGLVKPVTVKNKVSDGKTDKEVSTEVKPDSQELAGVEKEAIKVNSKQIVWKITVHVPASGLKTAKIIDTLPNAWINGGLYLDELKREDIKIENSKSADDGNPNITTEEDGKKIVINYDGGLKGTGKQRDIIITLTTKVNQTWLDSAEKDTNQAWLKTHENNVKLIANDVEFTTKAEAHPAKATVKKTGYKEEDKDGLPLYKYEVVVSGVTEKEFDIKDIFPTAYLKHYNEKGYEAKVTGGNQYNLGNDCTGSEVTVSDTTDGIKIHVELGEDPSKYGYYKISYYLLGKEALKDATLQTADKKYTFTNTATFGDASCSVDLTYAYVPLEKELVNGNEIHSTHIGKYKITVNPSAKRINNGNTYILTDKFENLSVDYSSVNVVTTPSGRNVEFNFDNKEGEFKIPDETSVVITYKARVVGNGDVNIKNTARIFGQDKLVNNWVKVDSSSGGTASTYSLKLLKYEKGHLENKLPGAKFALYVKKEDGNWEELTSDIETNANGEVTIQGRNSEWTLHPNTQYKIVEVQAPEGYVKDETPYLFKLTKGGQPDHDNHIYINGDELDFANEKKSEKPEETSVTVKKAWDDAEDQDGKRPDSLIVKLMKQENGKAAEEVQEVILTKDNGWTATVDNLPLNAGGKAIKYSWAESEVPEGYEHKGNATVGNVTTITNTHETAKTSVTVKKVWNDANNQDGLRPEKLTVKLMKKEEGKTAEEVQEVILTKDNGWTATVDNLPLNAGGKAIKYSWAESEVPEGYEHKGNATVGNVTTITNTHETAKTSVTVKKTWDDSNDASGKRPSEIKVKLYADLVLTAEHTLTADASGDWSYEFTDLPMYKEGHVGQKINYTVTEEEIPGYVLTDSKSSTEEGKTVVQLTNKSIDFKVNKFERTGMRELDGAKIQIKDSTGAVIAEWISKSGETHDFGSSLKAGKTYTIHEETAPSGYYTISDVNFTVDAKGQITLAGSSNDVKLEDGVIKICDERIKSSGGGGGGDHPHPLPETTPAETTPAETTVPETTPVETTNPGGGHGGPSEEVETDEYGRVRGANRGKNKKGQDGGNVKGANRGKTRTGDESMMSIFGFGFLAAVLVLLGWFGIRFTKRNRR